MARPSALPLLAAGSLLLLFANEVGRLFSGHEPHYMERGLPSLRSGPDVMGRATDSLVSNKSSVRFLFLIGLDGDTYDQFDELMQESPAAQRLQELGLAPALSELEESLLELGTNSDEAKALSVIGSLAEELRNESIQVAIRTFAVDQIVGSLDPTSTFFRLNSIYQACDQVQVRCEHVYISQDPNVLKSSADETIHWNTIALNLIYVEMALHAGRTSGCIDLSTSNKTLLDNESGFMGWTDREAHEKLTTLTLERQEEVQSDLYLPAIQELLYMDNVVMDLCLQQARAFYGPRSAVTAT